MMIKRYFIVFFTANSKNGFVHGQVDITVNNGLFINRAETIKSITSTEFSKKVGIYDVCLTNIIEINEDQYLAWKS